MKNADLKRIEKYLYQSMNNQDAQVHASSRTKIVATVGPSCSSYDKLFELVKVGVNVFRLNFSHGDLETKARIIQDIRKINDNTPYNVATLGDLQGPKLRVGDIEGGGVNFAAGERLIFTSKECIGTKERVYVSYPNLSRDIKEGDRILLDDGKMSVKVVNIVSDDEILVEVIFGGTLLPKKGFNLPDTQTSMLALTEKDKKDLDFIIKEQLDWVALSFVRHESDIHQINSIIQAANSLIKVIAKIEKPEAISQIDNIIDASDAIMIARGDLGIEMPVEEVPIIQKSLIAKCIDQAKPVIVATQMMESMISNIQLNRSEATDVANSVLDGADAVMLSAETATGKHPEAVVSMMRKIISKIETVAYTYNYKSDDVWAPKESSVNLLSESICYHTCKMASQIKANAIVGMTQSGSTGFLISSYRPKSPIYIFTKTRSLVGQLNLSWGVRSFFYDEERSIDFIIQDILYILRERGFVKKDDIVINTGSLPIDKHLPTNMIKVVKLD